jgi:multicomponent Na+:H+ antiporter subunit D
MFELPPALTFLAVALILPLFPKKLRAWFFLVAPAIALYQIGGLEVGTRVTFSFLGYELVPLRVDRLSLVFAWIFGIVSVVAGVYALHLRDTGQQVATLFYAGSALGVVFAGDLFTLFVFWEVMAVGSAYLTWARRTPESYRAGMRYVYVHLCGGALLLAGILMHLTETGSIAFEAFSPSAGAWLILVGFALNAAIPPLHAWLADAYPAATVTGAVFMSAFTTKSAVYTLARGFAGWEILVAAGVIMALYGVVYAVLANDIRQLLAYHIVSQVGYMVAGVGIGTEMALNGATAHAFTHILYKGLLFMGAGAVLYSTGRSKLSELGGLAKAMPWVVTLYMVGAFSISGFPLFSGFVSKAITVDAAAYAGVGWAVLLLHLASVGTFLHTGLKLPYFTWWAEDRGIRPDPIPWNMLAGMGLAAALNIFLGLYPQALYAILPYALDYEPYTYAHVLKASQMLLFTFVAFWIFRSKLGGEPLIPVDTDWIYRRPARISYFLGPATVARAFGAVERGADTLVQGAVRVGRDPVGWARARLRGVPGTEGQEGALEATSDSSAFRVSMTGMVSVLLFTLLVLMVRILT